MKDKKKEETAEEKLFRIKRILEDKLHVPTGAENWIDFTEIYIDYLTQVKNEALAAIHSFGPIIKIAESKIEFEQLLFLKRYKILAKINKALQAEAQKKRGRK
jgi:hypothetical protein